jgi:hypothetical protein
MNSISRMALDWSLKSLVSLGDTDLFPRPFEIEIIEHQWSTIGAALEKVDVSSRQWSGERRLLIPKDVQAFRRVHQLDPLETILLTALVYELGTGVEQRRRPKGDAAVFSYRFDPAPNGAIYETPSAWDKFWKTSKQRAQSCSAVVILDIGDFYNQLYHHVLNNQLAASGANPAYIKAIDHLVDHLSVTVSRGIPIGPHAAHLLAEACAIPLDDYLTTCGYDFCRYSDDIHIFCRPVQDPQVAILEVAEFLDSTQRLLLNKQKTHITSPTEFGELADTMLADQPINSVEKKLLDSVRRHASDPYLALKLSDLTVEEFKSFSKGAIEQVLRAYLDQQPRNYVRLRWFLRRLSQVGAPGGVDLIISRISDFMPAIADAINYIRSAEPNYSGDWATIGEQLLTVLELPIVHASDYLQTVLLSLFSRLVDLDHAGALARRYPSARPPARRKIVLAAGAADQTAWLQSIKPEYSAADPWLRRALLFSWRTLPNDERQHWYRHLKRGAGPLEQSIIEECM